MRKSQFCFTALAAMMCVSTALATPARSDRAGAAQLQSASADERARIRVIEAGLASTVAILPADPTATRQVAGSGFVYNAAGYIVTNAHVVGAATAVRLQTRDGRIVPATVVGRDGRSDIAVIRPHVPLGLSPLQLDRAVPLIGRSVFALGNPMGYRFSASRGIVSGHGRYYDANWPVGMVQHDAAINPGSSGGPLLNEAGAVVGMNTATPPMALYDIGIGLALPSAVIADIVPVLIRDGFVRRGALGVEVSSADPAVAEVLGAAGRSGLLIDSIVPGGAAERAGLLAGDLILSIDEAAVVLPRDLQARTFASIPGESVVLEIVRDGESRRVMLELQQDAAVGGLRARPATTLPTAGSAEAGAGLVFGPSGRDRVSLAEVRLDSPADREGLRRGDVILAINGRTVTTTAQAQEALAQATGPVLLLRVERPDRGVRHIVLPLTADAAAARPGGDPDNQPSGPI